MSLFHFDIHIIPDARDGQSFCPSVLDLGCDVLGVLCSVWRVAFGCG